MKMNSFALIFIFTWAFVAGVNSQECLANTQESCKSHVNKQANSQLDTICNARYGAINHLEQDLHKFAISHIVKSFEYLLMSTHFGNFEMNREGLHKLFRGYSDSKWSKGIELMKHITKRGGKMNFQVQVPPTTANYELYEIESLAKALDIEKSIIADAYTIHDKAIMRASTSHDPEISHYIEEEFIEKEAESIRSLSGHINDLSDMLAESEDNALSLYLFDNYLKDL